MPRLEPDTPLLDIAVSTTCDAEGHEIKYLTFKFGVIELQSCPLDAGQIGSMVRQLFSSAASPLIIIPIAHMPALCVPKQLRGGMLTLEKVKPRRSL